MLVLSSMADEPEQDGTAEAAAQRNGAVRPVAVGRMGSSLYAMPIGSGKAKSRRRASYVPRGKQLRGERGLGGVAAGGTRSVVAMSSRRERRHADGFMCPIGVFIFYLAVILRLASF
jgi:hypothetical protein